MYKIKTVKLKHCTCLMLYYISPSYKLTITTLFKDCLKQLFRKHCLLRPGSTVTNPTADPMTLWSASKVGGLGQKSTKKGGKILVSFTFPTRRDTSRLVWI